MSRLGSRSWSAAPLAPPDARAGRRTTAEHRWKRSFVEATRQERRPHSALSDTASTTSALPWVGGALPPTVEVEDRRRTSSQSVAPHAVYFPQVGPGITVRHQRIVVDGVHRLKQFSVVVELEAREAPPQV